jgi:hypothetical protein
MALPIYSDQPLYFLMSPRSGSGTNGSRRDFTRGAIISAPPTCRLSAVVAALETGGGCGRGGIQLLRGVARCERFRAIDVVLPKKGGGASGLQHAGQKKFKRNSVRVIYVHQNREASSILSGVPTSRSRWRRRAKTMWEAVGQLHEYQTASTD